MDGAGLWARANDNQLGLSADVVSRMSATAPVDDKTRLKAETSLRTAFVVLAVINALGGAATALGIYIDCRLRARRKSEPSPRRSPLSVIGTKEMVPFVVSVGIVAQGALFAAAQTSGLDSVLTLGCRPVSQMMLPALFIVPFTQTAFGIEAMIRSLPRKPMANGPAWTLPVCVGLVLAGLMVSYGVTLVSEPANFCFAELLFLLQRWSVGVFAVLVSIACLLLLCSIILLFRLYRTADMARPQRTAASWTACYMLLAVITILMTLPFFATLMEDDGVSDITREMMQLSTAATIVVNMTGLLTGALYLVLRLTRLGRLGYTGYVEYDRQRLKSGIRTVRASSVMYNKQLEQPVSPEWLERREYGTSAQAIPDEKTATQWPIQKQAAPRKAGGPSYNLFPQSNPPATVAAAAAGADAAAFLLPPTATWTARHERNSSFGSSATVPIALRVSNIDNMAVQMMSNSIQQPLQPPSNLGLAISTDGGPFSDSNAAYVASKNVDVFDDGEAEAPTPPPLTVTRATPDASDAFTLSPSVYSPKTTSTASPEQAPLRTPPASRQRGGEAGRAVASGQWI
ncbi:hypothetical protein XA68_16436 [Ophiocordyceps unilateralis]|uniref:Uncharacterized protein n=1 Tax=Ophiocordyceps unilateralis TaxID=268505 RepID=A0A2A9P668_OPHUN|nr:hypothetical protein XA68_16436 [Ophiocordyceps unilateralis]